MRGGERVKFLISASTDIGIRKNTNQDSLSVRRIRTPHGEVVFAILCDGMGGLAKGEVASGTVVQAFINWSYNRLPILLQTGIQDRDIRKEWEDIITYYNQRIMSYGKEKGIQLGTTVVVQLITQTRYYILNVGDSRVYELNDRLQQLTNDQTYIAREIKLGHMTEEEAKVSNKRNVLLQCVGASRQVCPEMIFGDTKPNVVYMLCSDGFRHEITPEEIYEKLQSSEMQTKEKMKENMESLIELNKNRLEQDNISLITIRVLE